MVVFVVHRCVVVLGGPYRCVFFGRGVYSRNVFMLILWYGNGPLLSQNVRQRSAGRKKKLTIISLLSEKKKHHPNSAQLWNKSLFSVSTSLKIQTHQPPRGLANLPRLGDCFCCFPICGGSCLLQPAILFSLSYTYTTLIALCVIMNSGGLASQVVGTSGLRALQQQTKAINQCFSAIWR